MHPASQSYLTVQEFAAIKLSLGLTTHNFLQAFPQIKLTQYGQPLTGNKIQTKHSPYLLIGELSLQHPRLPHRQ
jgi:hypothetical protein